LSPQALYQWRKRLVAGSPSRASSVGFVPIQIEPSMVPARELHGGDRRAACGSSAPTLPKRRLAGRAVGALAERGR
jgi:transposase